MTNIYIGATPQSIETFSILYEYPRNSDKNYKTIILTL